MAEDDLELLIFLLPSTQRLGSQKCANHTRPFLFIVCKQLEQGPRDHRSGEGAGTRWTMVLVTSPYPHCNSRHGSKTQRRQDTGPKWQRWVGMRRSWHSYVCGSHVSWHPGTILLQHRSTPCLSHPSCQLSTPTCLMHCRRSLVCWMCLSIEFILAVSLGPTREP